MQTHQPSDDQKIESGMTVTSIPSFLPSLFDLAREDPTFLPMVIDQILQVNLYSCFMSKDRLALFALNGKHDNASYVRTSLTATPLLLGLDSDHQVGTIEGKTLLSHAFNADGEIGIFLDYHYSNQEGVTELRHLKFPIALFKSTEPNYSTKVDLLPYEEDSEVDYLNQIKDFYIRFPEVMLAYHGKEVTPAGVRDAIFVVLNEQNKYSRYIFSIPEIIMDNGKKNSELPSVVRRIAVPDEDDMNYLELFYRKI